MEEIYVNVEYDKPVDPRPSTTQTGRRSSERRFHGVIILLLGLLYFVYLEQKFLTDFIKEFTWIGLNDREKEGDWKWINETPLTQAYWFRKQPDNGGGDRQLGEEDCVHMRHDVKTEENWNDLPCDASLPWICEKLP